MLAKCIKVLVVDDNIDGATTLSKLIVALGHGVMSAHCGESAIKMAYEFRPDLILLDIGMPEMNGYQTCMSIRKKVWGQTPVIIAHSAWGDAKTQHESEQAGFNGHLVKPADIVSIKQLLDDVMNTI